MKFLCLNVSHACIALQPLSSQVAFAIVDGARAGADDGKHAALVLVSSSNLSPVFVVVGGARAGADNNSDDDDKSEGNNGACVLVLSRDLSTVFVIVDGPVITFFGIRSLHRFGKPGWPPSRNSALPPVVIHEALPK